MANVWMDGSEAVRCPKCDGKKDFRGRDLGMLRILPTGNGRLADVSCHSCDTGYRVVCPGCQRYMIGLTATKGIGQDRSSSAHGRSVAGRTFFKCEGCDRMMDCGSHEIGLDEKRREGPGWPLWYGVVDRWWETRRAWRTALGIVQATRIRQTLAIVGLPFRLTLLLIHAVVALPLFAAVRLMAMALRLAIAVAGLGVVAAVAWAAWVRLSG